MKKANLFQATVGKKYLMGITGLIWSGFVLTHMLGNLLIFVGPEAYNSYSHALISNKLILAAEAFLVITLLSHVVMAVILTLKNKGARPTRYAMEPSGEKAASLASKTMSIQGPLILAFVIFHLVTFKFGEVYTTTVNGVEMRDIFRNVQEAFVQPIPVIGYVLAMILIGFHLSHGFGSAFQSLGLNHKSYEKRIKTLSWIYATIVAAGFLSQPIYIFFFYK